MLYLNIKYLRDISKKYYLFYLEKTVFQSNFYQFLKKLLQLGLTILTFYDQSQNPSVYEID